MPLKTPDCTYCGKKYAPEHGPGWVTNTGPGKFRDSACFPCRAKSNDAYDKALQDHRMAWARQEAGPQRNQEGTP